MVATSDLLAGLRVGFGFETGSLTAAGDLLLGGVLHAGQPAISGIPDGDIASHALLEALLSACGVPGVDEVFAGDEHLLADTESLVLMSQTLERLKRNRLKLLLNASLRVLLPEEIDLRSERQRMERSLEGALGLNPGQLMVTFGPSTDITPEVAPGKAIVFANLLCLVNTAVTGGAAEHVGRQVPLELVTAGNGGSQDADTDDADLPHRAREFEKAVKSKLPPLPKADKPSAGATLIIYTDGASRGNPGPAASGWVVLDATGALVEEGGSPLGERTNNQAEYMAVLEALRWVEAHLGAEYNLQVRMDSELIIRQLKGEYKVKNEQLKPLWLETMNQLGYFMHIELAHVPRAENQRADALANQVLDGKR
jgi:2-C-methyl-D-erythritol 2,4-cyclodiphosphate synthase